MSSAAVARHAGTEPPAMVSYSKILNEISRRFGSGLSLPGGAGHEARAGEPGQERAAIPAEEPDGAAEADSSSGSGGAEGGLPGQRTKEIDSEYLARIFRGEEGRGPRPAEEPAPSKETGTGGRAAPFRNHAELLKFASGLIADMEASFKAVK